MAVGVFDSGLGGLTVLEAVTQSPVEVTLDTVVPMTEECLPYVWVEGDTTAFEENMAAHEDVESCVREGTAAGRGLYRVEWGSTLHEIVQEIGKSRFTLLGATGNQSGWEYRVRFPDRDHVGRYVSLCRDHGFQIELERLFDLDTLHPNGCAFDLTQKQRDALEIAHERGYYETPRQVTLDDLAADLDISQQALSQRLRRGINRMISNGLLQNGA